LELIASMFDAGQLKVHVAQVFPLAKAREAQAFIAGPHERGEVILTVD
jgi:NADPH:quinone reductase-like Zn-dependent oxidoreductase